MSKGNMGTIEEGAKAGNFEPLHIKHNKTLMERCPYCYRPHVKEYLCLAAKRTGFTRNDLPGAYDVDTETGEVG